MAPPRRARSTSTASANAPTSPPPDVNRPTYVPSATPDGATSLGMSPAYRYAYNLKVLRRHDPSIVSIFDQFHHICVYHFDGEKWEKQGYEGTMFLFERESYPPYGFYVLNRVGSDDYVQLLYPEDAYKIMTKEILAIRSFPAFASSRIARATASLPPGATTGPNAKFHPAFAFNPDSMDGVDKGPSQVIGLWSYDPVTLREVLWRVHSYLVSHEPYPEQFRYGPDRPQPSGRVPSRNGMANPTHHRSTSSASLTGSERFAVISESDEDTQSPTAKPATTAQGASELDKLFAKLGTPSQSQSQSQPLAPQPNLLAQLTGQAEPPSANAGREPSVPPRGLSLLDTIFASATPPPQTDGMHAAQLRATSPYQHGQLPHAHHTQSPQARYAQAQSYHHHHQRQSSDRVILSMSQQHHQHQHHQHQHQQQPIPVPIPIPIPMQVQRQSQSAHQPPILSPRPKPSALPQVLNQDVLHSLLGMPRTPSSASSGADAERFSEGELSSSDASESEQMGGYGYRAAYGQRGHGYGQVQGARLMPGQSFAGSVSSMGSVGSMGLTGSPSGQVLGDVTPRPPLKGFASSGSGSGSGSGSVGSGVNNDMAIINERLGVAAASQAQPTMYRHNSSNSDATITVPYGHQHQHQHPHPHHHHHQPPNQYSHSNQASPLRIPDVNSPGPGPVQVPNRTGSVQAPTGPSVTAPNADARSRTLVPFADPSALWPYPRVPVDDRHNTDGASSSADDEGGDVVELDFADTSALSDPGAFTVQQMQGQARRGANGAGRGQANGSGSGNANANGAGGEGGRKGKKNRKERTADGRAKERAAIEASWDVPPALAAASPPPPQSLASGGAAMAGTTPNGPTPGTGNGSVNKAAAKDALLASLLTRDVESEARGEVPPFAGLGRNDFVREVLTLIHTDRVFVDSLYSAYAASVS